MRASAHLPLIGLALCAAFLTLPAAAQDNPAHAHIGHVADGFRGTPDGMGLLPTAMAEAAVAVQHAGFMARRADNLESAKAHAGHVLHALDPEAAESGPGAGYGLLQAAQGVVRHIELAAAAEGASDGVKTHSVHIATSARNTVGRAERMKELAQEILNADGDPSELVAALNELAGQLVDGADADGDGRVGWQEGEGGLAVADMHLGLMKRGEGLGG